VLIDNVKRRSGNRAWRQSSCIPATGAITHAPLHHPILIDEDQQGGSRYKAKAINHRRPSSSTVQGDSSAQIDGETPVQMRAFVLPLLSRR
jgi:hypothetical protein